MKKLSKLKLKNFTEMNDLEMKNVIGGYGGSGGGYGSDQMLCQVLQNGHRFFVSKETAEKAVRDGYATNWCCDSCCSSSWADKGDC